MKKLVKMALNVIFTLAGSPFLLAYFILTLVSNKNNCFSSLAQLLSLFPGIFGSYLRKNSYALMMKNCHRNTYIGFGTLFSQWDTSIDYGVYIGPQCNIGKCSIEKNVLLGSAVHILSGKNQHNFDDIEKPIRDQGGTFETVSIGENSWIGNGAIVMANIGRQCIVGAGSVVVNDIPDFSIVAGNPARVIKNRVP